MVKIRFPFLLLPVAIMISGCGGAKVSKQPRAFAANTVCENHVFQGVVLLATENATWAGKHFSPLWNPSANIVDEATDKISPYLLNVPANNGWQMEDMRNIRDRLPKTVCQAVGITFEGSKAILLNCLSSKNTRIKEHWREYFIKVYDGGPRYWNVVYIPESGSFTNLEINWFL